MTVQVHPFSDKLRNRLDAIEERIQSAKSQILALPEQGEKAMSAKLDETRNELQSRKQRFEQTLARLKAHVQQKVAEAKEDIADWKAKRDLRKLNTRADRAEAYAADALDFALAAIDEAAAAILDAMVARIDADAAL
jgi:exonuclease VII large subunit